MNINKCNKGNLDYNSIICIDQIKACESIVSLYIVKEILRHSYLTLENIKCQMNITDNYCESIKNLTYYLSNQLNLINYSLI